MKISIFNLKGGVGKTSLALNLAIELKYPFIENDEYGGIYELLNKNQHKNRAFLVNSDINIIPQQKNIIYDFGSFIDHRIKKVLIDSDLVIVPTLHSYQDIKSTIKCIRDLQKLGQSNILVLVNRVDNKLKKVQGSRSWYADFEETKNAIKDKVSNIEFLPIRQNKGWQHSTLIGKSIIELANNNGLMANNFATAIDDLNLLIETILEHEERIL